MSSSTNRFLKTLGPGILFASTAIGVSHLVQSTRAGAVYGFALLWVIIAANVFKYPFFEYGSRYANAAGESIIDGYKKLGKWVLFGYFIITICSMFFVTAAVGAVTAGFFDNLFGISSFVPSFPLLPVSLVFSVCMGILIFGKYAALDTIIKIVGTLLLVSTIFAFVLALMNGPTVQISQVQSPSLWDGAGIAFIIALMGWMPTAVDLSAWNSLWTLERIKQSGYKPTLKETIREFNLGYWISAGLSICFVTLGAFLIYGTQYEMPSSSAIFANWVVELYTSTIGQWSYWIIALASFSIMFGTSIGVFDGYARSLERVSELVFLGDEGAQKALQSRKVYIISLLVIGIGSYFIIAQFSGHLRQLVDVATTVSFLIAPAIAIANFILVKKFIPKEAQPGRFMQALSYAGILFLIGFSAFFIYSKMV